MPPLQRLKVPDLPPAVGPYCDAVRAGNLLFISGYTAVDQHGQVMCRGDVAGQARQALTYIERALREVQGTVAKVTVYLRNVQDLPKIGPVRREFFGEHLPASTLVEVSKLFHEDVLVEIDAIAVLDH